MKHKCIAYVRVSTVRQGEKGVSLQEQERAIKEYASRNNLTITDWFEEKKTAAKRGRPAFSKIMALLKQGKADGVIMHKIDRGARNLRDWADLGELIDAGVAVHVARDSLDLHSRGGRLSADIQAVVAADFIRNLRDETKKGFYGRLRQGLLPAPAPLGYLNNGKGTVKTIDPVRGPLIREAVERYASGRYSIRSLQREMKGRGLTGRSGKPVAVSSLTLILKNPFYMGLIHIKRSGESFAGIHEPLIGAGLYRTVQERLRGRTQSKVRVHSFTFRQLVRCDSCGNSLVGEIQRGHTYYRCHTLRCPLRCVREEHLDTRIKTEFARLQLRPEEKARLRDLLHNEKGHQADGRTASRRALTLQLQQVEDRLLRLTDAFLDKVVERQLFEDRKRLLLIDQAETKEKIGALKDPEGDAVQLVSELLEQADTALLSYELATGEERREMVETMTSNRRLLPNGLVVELSLVFRLIAERESVLTGCPARDASRSEVDLPETATSEMSYLARLVRLLLDNMPGRLDSPHHPK